jgi:hypothetical protein
MTTKINVKGLATDFLVTFADAQAAHAFTGAMIDHGGEAITAEMVAQLAFEHMGEAIEVPTEATLLSHDLCGLIPPAPRPLYPTGLKPVSRKVDLARLTPKVEPLGALTVECEPVTEVPPAPDTVRSLTHLPSDPHPDVSAALAALMAE